MSRRRSVWQLTVVSIVLVGASLGGAAAAQGAAQQQQATLEQTTDECVEHSSGRVPKWAKELPEPTALSPAQAAQVEQRMQPGVTAAERESARGQLRNGRIPIPTWIHVISIDETSAGGNVSDDQIDAQMRVLNSSFAGQTGGGAPTVFRFVLAGTSRTVNPSWAVMDPESDEELAAKTALHRGGPGTLNIYVTQTPQYLGWAYLPDGQVENTVIDGVVVLDGSLPGGDVVPYNEGDTVVHEVGHWLSLWHTFDNGCRPPGDYVVDTPYEAEPAFGCPIGRNTCRQWGTDPVKNFMDYADDPCMDQFSRGQSIRMWASWLTYRQGAPGW